MQDYLRQRGDELTADWTRRAFSRSYDQFRESAEYAEEEVRAILESDIFIHLSDGEGGKGKFVDLGIALAGNKIQQSPLIYVIGNPANESQFYFHPAITRIVHANPIETLCKISINHSNENDR